MPQPSRRHLIQGLLATGGGALLGWPHLRARADADDPRFLIVLGCFGGAAMIDAFMPIDAADALSLADRGTVLSHETARPTGANIQSVARDTPYNFLDKHRDNMAVLATQGSSVNHYSAQARWITGRDMYRGWTMAELVAATHGTARVLPNVSMGRAGFATTGADRSMDPRYRAEIVTNPVTFPLSTHGHLGVLPYEGASEAELRELLVARARAFRDDILEAGTPFAQTFSNARVRRSLLQARRGSASELEVADLIEQLLFVPDLGEAFPLSAYGLSPSEEVGRILEALPDAFPNDTSGTPEDRLQAQAALAYLLLRTGASAAVTLTEPGTDGFLAFDQSHQSHKAAQETHWDRVLSVADSLIGLLDSAEFINASGDVDGTLWDRTMLVFATEFGRDKWQPTSGASFGTGHNLNNGLLVMSPLIRGNQTLGAPDPNNGFICGFDLETGEATPFDDLVAGEDPLYDDLRLPPGEEIVCGGLLHLLGVEFEGQQTVPVLSPS